jgi:predicted transcriptional regulator
MSKESVFTMKLEPELRDAFMAEAEASHRPASQVVRDLMREFVERQRKAREYEAFLRGKVDTARAQIAEHQGRQFQAVLDDALRDSIDRRDDRGPHPDRHSRFACTVSTR